MFATGGSNIPSGGTALLQAITEITPAFGMARYQRKVLLLISDGNDTQTNAAGALPPPPSEIGDLTAHFGDSQRTQRRILIERSRNAVQVRYGVVCHRHRYPQRRAC